MDVFFPLDRYPFFLEKCTIFAQGFTIFHNDSAQLFEGMQNFSIITEDPVITRVHNFLGG